MSSSAAASSFDDDPVPDVGSSSDADADDEDAPALVEAIGAAALAAGRTTYEDVYESLETLLELATPAQRSEAVQAAIHAVMVKDTVLQDALINTVMRLRGGDTAHPEIKLGQERAIFLTIEADDAKFESLRAIIQSMEFIVYLSRRAIDRGVISPLEYASLRNMLARIGFPHIGLTKYPSSLGVRFEEIGVELERKETARRRLFERVGDDPEMIELLETLDLHRPIDVPVDELIRGEVPDHILFELLDEYCRFGNLCEDGMSNTARTIEYILTTLRYIPRLNGGYALLNTLTQMDDETEEEFGERAISEARESTGHIARLLGSHPEAYRFGVMVCRFAELNITGILPEGDLTILDERPEIQAFISNIRRTGRGSM